MRLSKTNERFVDLTWTIDAHTPIFPGDPAIAVDTHSTVARQGHAISTWSSGMHVGTHLDAPAHFLTEGGDVASIPLSRCAGNALVVSITPKDGVISSYELRKIWKRHAGTRRILLLSTGWANHRFDSRYFSSFPGFDRDFPALLAETGIELIGVDMPSVRYADGDYAGFHRLLLEKGIVIVENLIGLDEMPNKVWFAAMPLKLKGFDGSMVRAFARVKASFDPTVVDKTSCE